MRHRLKKKKKKIIDYAFRHQFDDKPSIMPGCPESQADNTNLGCMLVRVMLHLARGP